MRWGAKSNREQDYRQVGRLPDELNHGRAEARQCRVLSADLLPEEIRQEWDGLTTLVEIRSERSVLALDEHYSLEYRYYLASKVESPAFYNKMVRGHWGIENQLHWAMDVQFGEDKSRKRAGNAAQNFALIQRLVFNLLKTNGEKPKVSIHRRMNKCAMSDEYRRKTLKF